MNSHVDHVVEATALGDRTESLLMVAGRVDGGDTVDTSWESLGNISGQDTALCDIVETLEEIKDFGIQGLRRVERCQFLYSNVTVTLNDTFDQLLRSGIVSVGRIRERSGGQVEDLEGDGEWGIGGDGIEVLWGVEFGGRLPGNMLDRSSKEQKKTYHVINGRNITHGSRVAGTRLDLLPICNGLANTEPDEVIPGDC